jgi:hypothetical protein
MELSHEEKGPWDSSSLPYDSQYSMMFTSKAYTLMNCKLMTFQFSNRNIINKWLKGLCGLKDMA